MSTRSSFDYGVLDSPEVLICLFHPRVESSPFTGPGNGIDLAIPVETDIHIGARFHMTDRNSANLLFFHGNGEIVSDYDDLAPLYNRIGINFMPVDYRGYGRSNGTPTVTAMLQDSHTVFDFARDWLARNDYQGPLIVMGRSLGSAPALELASRFGEAIDALVIESGFALATPLLKLLGVDTERLGFEEKHGFRNTDKIARFRKSTLIIHAEFDHIIPFSDGKLLYESSGADEKQILMIPGANHNDIFSRGLSEYVSAIGQLAKGLAGFGD
jgi:fermentation-respiration switch protein FrsA (DUF1100 family)